MLKIMNKKLNTFALSTALALSAEAINFVDFNIHENYNEQDYRCRKIVPPFPLIFHYNAGDEDSTSDFFLINAQQPTGDEIPQSVSNFITQNTLQNVQYFEAYCESTQADCNYFTHTWSMDKMIDDRITTVSTGMFEAHNLAPINGQIGVNALVAQNMSYHGSVYLSGDSAKFQIVDPNQLADAWFISVYNPQDNDGNISDNQVQKTIVVHWYFYSEGTQIDAQQYPTLFEAVKGHQAGQTVMAPQITPVK